MLASVLYIHVISSDSLLVHVLSKLYVHVYLSLTQGNVTFDSTGNRVGNSVRIAQYMRGEGN